MKILKEGTITIQPDGTLLVTGFYVSGGSLEELMDLVKTRLRLAYERQFHPESSR